ncbi:aldehyde dehydrogenase [Dipodascopsis tothii]|uniref:aldehyde dehydrogenase n=1 Tax=Dipodascopsis tothii TaxID=44089 RepID=UPI0034CD2F55
MLPVLAEIDHIIRNVSSWARPHAAYASLLAFSVSSSYTEPIPYGTVLIIAPFNYPLMLSVSPVAGALAAGNAVVLKPSELTPRFTDALVDVLTAALDPAVFAAFTGGPEVSTALLDCKFDKILFTGGAGVGRIVARKAAETLTPVLLELGGKSPAFVTPSAAGSLRTTARRLVWGALLNAGQTCTSVDYVVAHDSVYDALLEHIRDVIANEFYPNDTAEAHLSFLVNDRAYARVSGLLDATAGHVELFGKPDPARRFMPPALVSAVDWSDPLMADELFGPLIPVLRYTDLADAVAHVAGPLATPLAVYVFSTVRAEQELVLAAVPSGQAVINDVTLQVANYALPFGGVGTSGMGGGYHGHASFLAFSHQRACIRSGFWNEFALSVRYPATARTAAVRAHMLRFLFLPRDTLIKFAQQVARPVLVLVSAVSALLLYTIR